MEESVEFAVGASEVTRSFVGLMSSYTGSNLGDGAVMHAVRENLTALMPDVRFCVIGLDPIKTRAVHGLPGLPITGLILSEYSFPLKEAYGIASGNGGGSGDGPASLRQALWQRLKNSELARRLLRRSWQLLRSAAGLPINLVRDFRHSVRMYRLLRRFRVVVVCGGGQIDDYWGGPFGHPYALWKWSWLCKLAGARFVVLSVGVDTLASPLSRSLTRRMLDSADYRSFRDTGSKKILADAGIVPSSHVTPDLAFSYPRSEIPRRGERTSSSSGLHVGINPIAYMHVEHWPEKDEALYQRYEDALTEFTAWLLAQGHRVTIYSTDAPDADVSAAVCRRIEPQLRAIDAVERLRCVSPGSSNELLKELTSYDLVVASRLHGVILAHVVGVPTVALSYSRKVTCHMQDMGLERLCLNILDAEPNRIIEAFECCRAEIGTLGAEIAAKAATRRDELNVQYARIAALVAE